MTLFVERYVLLLHVMGKYVNELDSMGR